MDVNKELQKTQVFNMSMEDYEPCCCTVSIR